MSAPKLRLYQEQALAAEDAYRAEHPDENRLLIEMATGLGKSITLGERARRFLAARWVSGQDLRRVLILVHTDHLVRQLADDARMMAPAFQVGIVMAGQNDTTADIVVASVQTLAQPGRKEQIRDVGYIIVDEAHHAVATSYESTLRHFGALPIHKYDDGSLTPVLGVTATPARSDGAGLGSVWHHLIFSRNITWGIRHGYLVDCVPYAVRVPDVTIGGASTDLDAQLADGIAPELVADTWVSHFHQTDEPSTILFAPLVKSANAFAEAFRNVGVHAVVIHGEMPAAEKASILAQFSAGEITVLCNAMMMTEGVNIPRIKCVIWARPVRKPGAPLLIQGVGRGLRPWIGPDAPPREEQRCTLLMVTPSGAFGLAGVADLSDNIADGQDGKSLLQMADEWDLGKELDAAEAERLYRGPVKVERWDAAVQASSKAWKYTAGGIPFLPTAKRGVGYVFVVERGGEWLVWSRRPAQEGSRNALQGRARDLELALALAEDVALEQGGDIGRMLADKGRAWRKAVASPEMTDLARTVGVPEKEIGRIITSTAGGKAGRLSDLIDKAFASRVLDPLARKIRERV